MVEEGAKRRVVVEVCNARNLMPKDGQGTACAYAVVDFDGQRRRTATRPRDLNPQWGERLEFLVHHPDAMTGETLELNVYNDKKAIAGGGSGGGGSGRRGGTFLGKVKVAGASFAKEGDETLVYYPLEKRSVFSQIKGEIGLKIWFVDEPPPPPPAPAAEEKADASAEKKDATEEKGKESAAAPAAEEKKPEEAAAEAKKAEEAKPEEKKPEAGKKDGKKNSPEKGKKDGEKPKEEAKSKEEKKEAAPPSPSKAPPPSPSKMQLSNAGIAGDLEIRPQSAAERSMTASGGSASYDLVDRVPYLFVRLLKAKHQDDGNKQPLYAQLSIGAHTVRTRSAAAAGEWDQVFAFHKASLTASSLEVTVHEEAKKPEKEGEPVPADPNLGFVSFDLQEVPKRSPPDSALAPQWYTLEGHADDGTSACDVMLAVWVGTQVDEAFQEAWQSDSGGNLVHTRSKAYLSPKLWYLRLSVIQAQDLRLPSPPDAKAKQYAPSFPELYVKAQLGAQVFKTGRIALGSAAAGASNPDRKSVV